MTVGRLAALLAALTLGLPAAAAAHRRAATTQVISVTGPHGHLATLTAYTRARAGAPWRAVLGPWPVEIGRGGLRAHRHEGDGSTPIGDFALGSRLYGNARRPAGLHEPYVRLRCGDWWDEDPSSAQYNRFVALPCGRSPGFAGGSEPLWTETVAYPYFAVIRFNADPIVRGPRAPGSGIFLHSWVGGPTDGCVALPRARLLRVLRWLAPRADPRIVIGGAQGASGALAVAGLSGGARRGDARAPARPPGPR